MLSSISVFADIKMEKLGDDFLVKGVIGSAQIYNGDQPKALAQADRVALKRALEYAMGVELKSQRFLENSTMLRDIIHAHSSGHAKLLRRNRQWIDGDRANVEIDAIVYGKKLEALGKKLSQPGNVIVQIRELITDDFRVHRRRKIRLQNGVERKIQKQLSDIGYNVWRYEGTLELAIAENKIRENVARRGLAQILIVGTVAFELDDSEAYPNGINLTATATLEALRFDPTATKSTNRQTEIYALEPIVANAIAPRNYVVGHVEKDIFAEIMSQDLVGKLEKWTGSINRSVRIYVEGLPDLLSYEDFQERLRQNSVLVENVNGVIFDKAMSRIDLILTEQSLVNGELAAQLEYLGTSIDADENYKVKRKGRHSILVVKSRHK